MSTRRLHRRSASVGILALIWANWSIGDVRKMGIEGRLPQAGAGAKPAMWGFPGIAYFLQYRAGRMTRVETPPLRASSMEISLLFSWPGLPWPLSILPPVGQPGRLGTGARYGFPASLRHVVGATLGFILLLLLWDGAGLGGAPVPAGPWWPGRPALGRCALSLLPGLAVAGGLRPGGRGGRRAARLLVWRRLMQWLSPKAWLAASMGMGPRGRGRVGQIALFTALYLVICPRLHRLLGYAGSRLQGG